MNHTTDTGLSCARRIQYFGLAMWIYVVLQFVTGFVGALPALLGINTTWLVRSEEHTSELQSQR